MANMECRTPHDIYLESVEELKKWQMFPEDEHNPIIDYQSYDYEDLLDFIKSHTISMLEADIERLEEEKSPYRPNDREYYNDKHRECGWQAFKQRQIDYKKEQIKKIQGV